MPIRRQSTHNSITRHWIEYSDKEIEEKWDENSQGHRQSVERGKWCVVRKCNKKQAIELSRWFYEKVFGIITCTHYDNDTISLYCGDAGHGAQEMYNSVSIACDKFIKHRSY